MSAMVKCLLCGKEFKNEAGLSGHIRMVHPDAIPVASSDLDRRLEAVELRIDNLMGLMEKVVDRVVDNFKLLKEREVEDYQDLRQLLVAAMVVGGNYDKVMELYKQRKVEAEVKAGAKTKKGGE